MRTIHSRLLVLLLLGAACCCHGAGITLTFDPALERVMPNLVFGSTAVTAEVDLIHANKTQLATVDFHLSPFMVPAAITASGNYTSKPIAIASMCLASNVGSGTGLTLQQIGAALSGSASGPTVGIRWHVAQPTMSPASALLLQTLVLNGIAPFTTTASWPASVLSNPNVVLLADDPSISFALSNCPSSVGCVGPQLGFAPWSAPMSCLRIRRTVTLTGDSISYTPALTTASARYTVVDPQFGVAYAQGPVYPFIGGIYLSARKTVTCRVVDALNAFFTNSTNQAALSSLGLQAVSNGVAFTTLNMMATLSNGPNCTSTVLTTTIKGDPNLADAISTLNFNAVTNGANSSSDSSSSSSTYSNSNRNSYSTVNYMVGFAAATTAAILNDVYNPQTKNHAALVEGLPNATLNATSTSIASAPIFAHGLALIYTLDGRDGLVASLCTLLGIMNGTIQYWDDAALTADNVGIDLPHLKITRIMSSDASQEAAGRGVSYIARRCGVPLTSVYSAYPFGTDVPAVTSRVVAQIQTVEGAIGFASTSAAIAASMQQLAILFPSEQQVSGTVTDLSAVSALLTVDASTNAIVFPPDTVDYFPFVAIVYAIVDTNANGSCTSYKKTLGWLKYAAGSKAQDPLQYGNQVVLSSTIRALTTAAIARVRCDGVSVYPVTVRTPAPTPVADVVWWPYAVSVGAVVALIALFGGRAGYRWWVLSVRPTDPTKAIAVMFVGIKNQAAVLEAGEENATAVHARVADTIRYLVRKHGCYESRRIDSTTTMIVAKDATRAAACAEDIVLQLSVDVPWLETVMTHPMPQKKANVRGDMRHSETGSETSNAPHTGRRASVKRSASQPNSARREALVQHISLARQSPSPSPRSGATPPSTPPTRGASYVRNTSNPALRRITSQLESPHNAPSKLPSSVESKTQHTSTSHTGLTLQQCVPEVYVGLHWTHVMVDVQDDAVSYRGAGINTAACIADLAVGGQVIVSREFMDCLNVDLGDDDGGYHFATVGDGKSSDELVGMSLTTERFPEWLIARSALRRKSLEEKDNSDGNMIAAAMASADGALARRRIAVVSMLVRDLLREGADGRAPVIGETLAELLDIVTSNRGQIHSITDGVVTVTVGAGAPVAMAAVRAAQIAMEASELCVAIGVNSGSALVGNAMGGKAATVGRVVAGAALMRVAAARAAVPICATDVAKADLAAKFELATVDLIAAPWDRTKHVRCFAIVEERARAEEGEWLYDMNDGFAPLEQRFDWHAMRQTCDGAPPVNIHSAFLCRQEPIISLSDDLYMALQQATEGAYVHDFYLSRLHTLGSFGFSSGCSVVV